MNKKEVKLNNQRVSFSRKIKRKILLEVAKGKSPQEALLMYAFDSIEEISKDKKYASKLLHKWRKEMYENKEILNFLNHQFSFEMLDCEIDNMGSDEENERIFELTEIEMRSLKPKN